MVDQQDKAAREERRRQAELVGLRERCQRLEAEVHELDARLELVGSLEAMTASNARIVPRERASGLREATAIALASDWHVGELVEQEKVINRNSYNLEIARARAGRFFEGIVWLTRTHSSAFAIRDLVVWLGGDIITGYIHEELVESSLCSPTLAVVFARELISSGLEHLLRELPGLERIAVLCNHGNHGRTTLKRRIATGAENSFEHLLFLMLAREWAHEPRVQWHVTRAEHLYAELYGEWTRWLHGDEVKYDRGIGGVFVPVNRALHRLDSVRPVRSTFMGHFHTYAALEHCTLNGSLVGYNPFAMKMTLPYEPPRQGFLLWDSRRGPCMRTPIWVDGDEERQLWR